MNPLTWLRRLEWQKHRISEYGQVIEQLIFPGEPNISPSLTIAPPVSVDKLSEEGASIRLLPAVIARGKSLLTEHLAWIQAEDHEGTHGR